MNHRFPCWDSLIHSISLPHSRCVAYLAAGRLDAVKRIVLISALLGTLALPALYVGLRYRAVHKFFSNPELRQRMNVVPTHRQFSASPAPVQSFDLGYATVDVGVKERLTISSVLSSGTIILISNAAVSVCFWCPFMASNAPASDAYAHKLSGKLKERLLAAETGHVVELATQAEQTMEASFWTLCLMSREESMLYIMDVTTKAGCTIGRNQVYSFEAPFSKGLTRIGEKPADRSYAFIMIASKDSLCRVGCHVRAKPQGKGDIAPMLESIASSFKFTMAEIPAEEKLHDVIRQHGVLPAKKSDDSEVQPKERETL